MPGEVVLAEGHIGGGGFCFAHYWYVLVKVGGEEREFTVSVNGSVCAFCDVEEVRPLCEVGEVEVKVICLGQRVEVGGVEFEDIHCVEGAQGSHFQDLRSCGDRDWSFCPNCSPELRD